MLGTVGLAAVMFRNVLERRRELALLRAVGYNRRRVSQMILAEAVLLLGAGLGAGVLSALLAVIPAWTNGSGGGPGAMLIVLLAGVPEAWLEGDGISLSRIRTTRGPLWLSARRGLGLTLSVQLNGAVPPGGIVIDLPGERSPREVWVDGEQVRPDADGTVRIRKGTARVRFN